MGFSQQPEEPAEAAAEEEEPEETEEEEIVTYEEILDLEHQLLELQMESNAKVDRNIRGMDQNQQLDEFAKLIAKEEEEMNTIRKKTADKRAGCFDKLKHLQTC